MKPDQSYDCESSLIDRDQITEPRPKIYTPDTVSRYTGYGTKTKIHKWRPTEPKTEFIKKQGNQGWTIINTVPWTTHIVPMFNQSV